MSEAKYYLKPNVQIEPLVNLWHAYPFVIAPAATAMVTANYQMTTMKSYLQMPMAHVAALKNPDMVGGPFIDYNGGRLKEIKALKESTENNSGELLEFAKGIKELNELLRQKGKGYPLEDIYKEVPEVLRGYIELVYDLEHRATYRFIENLLYQSPLYDESTQSIALTLISSDDRPFIFSTPRLKDEHIVHLPIKFSDERIDKLGELREEPQTYAYIKELLSIPDEDDETFMSFLKEEPPQKRPGFTEDGVRVSYYGHACVLLETKDVTVMTDLLISYKYESNIPRYTFEDLPESIDYVVITHCHHDHIVLETLLQLRSKIKNIVVPKAGNGYLQDPSMRLILENVGFENIIEIDEMERINIPGGSITGLPFYGEHCDLNIRSKSTYAVKFDQGGTFLMVADSSSINPDVYKNAHKAIGDIDMLFVGMECTGAPMSWSYGAFFTEPLERQLDQVRRSKGSDSATALELIDIFNPSHVYLYAMGSEPWLNYFMALQHGHSSNTDEECAKLLQICQDRGIESERLFAKKEIIWTPETNKENQSLTLEEDVLK
ncbi:MAG: MBL fold metallo-hydrolase [Bacteroidota bacterium]